MLRRFRRAAGLALALTLVASFVQGAEPHEWRGDYAAARKEAEEKKLPLLVVIGTVDCSYCRKLETTTFGPDQMKAKIAGQYIPVKIDATANPEFAKAMRVNVYPTTVIAGADGKVLAYLGGYITDAQFSDYSVKALALQPAETKDDKTASKTKPAPNAATTVSRTKELVELEDLTRQLDEKYAVACLGIGDAWAEQGKAKEASESYEKVLRLIEKGPLAEKARTKLAGLKVDR